MYYGEAGIGGGQQHPRSQYGAGDLVRWTDDVFTKVVEDKGFAAAKGSGTSSRGGAKKRAKKESVVRAGGAAEDFGNLEQEFLEQQPAVRKVGLPKSSKKAAGQWEEEEAPLPRAGRGDRAGLQSSKGPRPSPKQAAKKAKQGRARMAEIEQDPPAAAGQQNVGGGSFRLWLRRYWDHDEGFFRSRRAHSVSPHEIEQGLTH